MDKGEVSTHCFPLFLHVFLHIEVDKIHFVNTQWVGHIENLLKLFKTTEHLERMKMVVKGKQYWKAKEGNTGKIQEYMINIR